MADKWPLANGNWSDSANWNGGTLPLAGDDVYLDGRTIVLDQDITVLSLRNTQRSGGTIGGSVSFSVNRVITANIFSRDSSLLTIPANTTLTVTGNIDTGSLNQYIFLMPNTGATLNIIGTISPNTTGAGGATVGGGSVISLTSSSTVNITGNLFGSWHGSSNRWLITQNAGTINIVGNATASPVATAQGAWIINLMNGNINITGTLTGGGSGRIDVYGIGNGNGTTSGIITINGTCAAGLSPAINLGTTNGGGSYARVIMNGNMVASSNGTQAICAPLLTIHPTSTQEHTYRVNNGGVPGVARTLYTGGQNLGQPGVENVRLGTVYGVSNEFTGVCAVPGEDSVLLGVPVDQGLGIVTITATDIRAALGLSSANLDTQLSGISNKTNQLTFTVANQVDANSLTGGLTQSQVRSAVGLSSANLDTQLATKPSLSQIEASTVLSKEATVVNRPTLTQIESSTVLAKSADITNLQNNSPTEAY